MAAVHKKAASILARYLCVHSSFSLCCCGSSAEGERKSLHARIEKLDLELSIGDGLRLSDQLIQPLFGHRAVALLVDVDAVSRARRLVHRSAREIARTFLALPDP